jgi:glycosyltransferase involved in cell wall biosynthesis
MALSKPVIVSPVGGMPEVVDDNKDGVLVNPLSIKDLSNAIVDLLSNPEKCDRLGYEAEKRFREIFDVRVIEACFNDLYREMVNKPL